MQYHYKMTAGQQFFVVIVCLFAALSAGFNVKLMQDISKLTAMVSNTVVDAVDVVTEFESRTIDTLSPIKVVRSVKSVNQQELQCLAENIYYEARGESLEGKIAVAQVTLNRVKNKRWPSNVCAVVYQEFIRTVEGDFYDEDNSIPRQIRTCQFSWVCESNRSPIAKNSREWQESVQIARSLLSIDNRLVDDITNGATFFHAKELGRVWPEKKRVAVIDNHVFYRR